MSHARTISKPPPIAAPLTAAIIGLPIRFRRHPAKPHSGWVAEWIESPCRIAPRSPPEQKVCLGPTPAPVSTTARTPGSCSASTRASPISVAIDDVTALCFAGRFNVSTRTGPRHSRRTSKVAGTVLPGRQLELVPALVVQRHQAKRLPGDEVRRDETGRRDSTVGVEGLEQSAGAVDALDELPEHAPV